MEISKVCWGTMWSVLTAEKLQNQFCWTNTAVNYQLHSVMCCDEGCTSNSRWKCQHWQWVAARGYVVTLELYYHLCLTRQQKNIQALSHFCVWLKKKKEHYEHYMLYEFVLRQLFLTLSVTCLLKCIWNIRLSRQKQHDWNVSGSLVEWVRVEVKTENLRGYWGRRKQAAGQLKYLSWGEGTSQERNRREVVRNLYVLNKHKRTQQEYLLFASMEAFRKLLDWP